MIQLALSRIAALMQVARETYHVDPRVFLVIYLVSVPVFYYSLVRTIRALARRQGNDVVRWSAMLLCAIVAPFVYVLMFGRNLPWWVYGIIVVLVGQGVCSLTLKLRRTSLSRTKR